MKTEFINQYAHTWRVFERLVSDFDQAAWFSTGRDPINPARLSFHVLQAVKFYIEDKSVLCFASGKSFEGDSWKLAEKDLPSQDDILDCIQVLKARTEQWLSEMDFGAKNTAFVWAGECWLGVVIFLLRHTLFHLGELSALLNESKNGMVDDHYVKAL